VVYLTHMRTAGFVALIILSLGIVGYTVVAYSLFAPGALVHPDMRSTFQTHQLGYLYVHIFASAVALALGPFQFWTRLRVKLPALHRQLGKVYLGVGILFGGLAALPVAFNAHGGSMARVGFAVLAVSWLFTGLQAYRAIRARDFQAHRSWMVRNFALTFAAVTLRIWLPGLVASGVAFSFAYPLVAWLCWIPNVVLAELVWNKSQ
jgi:uncharacterized membrane protein